MTGSDGRNSPSSLLATCPLITPSPEGSTANFNSPMKATAPVASKTPLVAKPNLPVTPALVQVGEPYFTANPSEKRCRAKNPFDITTIENGLAPAGIPLPVQFEWTT